MLRFLTDRITNYELIINPTTCRWFDRRLSRRYRPLAFFLESDPTMHRVLYECYCIHTLKRLLGLELKQVLGDRLQNRLPALKPQKEVTI